MASLVVIEIAVPFGVRRELDVCCQDLAGTAIYKAAAAVTRVKGTASIRG